MDSQARRIVGAVPAGDGNVTLVFAGVPGYNYRVQAATDLTPPADWLFVTNNFDGGNYFIAGPDGFWTHTDFNATNFSSRFYRTVEP